MKLEIHDEYWHLHVDRNNTPHYHYSGLLYMSTYEENFNGGRLIFYNSDQIETIIEPKRGRIAIFSSGAENSHRVEKVISGERFVLSFWFTCDKSREFEIFLDGNAHLRFSKKVKESITRSRQKEKIKWTDKSTGSIKADL
jgi:predicted 2-oxoglutarate/Fe(II)-dependent dioxygenase YbiX